MRPIPAPVRFLEGAFIGAPILEGVPISASKSAPPKPVTPKLVTPKSATPKPVAPVITSPVRIKYGFYRLFRPKGRNLTILIIT